jgi:hypothetical protein
MKIILTLSQAYMFGQAVNGMSQSGAKLSSDTTRKLAVNAFRINQAFPNVDAETSRLFREFGEPKETDPKYKDYLEAKIKYSAETTIEIDAEEIEYTKLGIGTSDRDNHFPPAFVTALLPMLDIRADVGFIKEPNMPETPEEESGLQPS